MRPPYILFCKNVKKKKSVDRVTAVLINSMLTQQTCLQITLITIRLMNKYFDARLGTL